MLGRHAFLSLTMAAALAFGLQTQASAFQVNSKPPTPAELRSEFCRSVPSLVASRSGGAIAAKLGNLINSDRASAIGCLVSLPSFALAPSDIAAIVGVQSTPYWRRANVCRLREHVPPGRSASDIATILNTLAGEHRSSAFHCLLPKIGKELSATEALQVLGPLLPNNDPSWTLMSYNELHHRSVLCGLSDLLRSDLSAADTANLLGLARDSNRSRILGCIVHKVALGLTWEDVDKIVGPSIKSRGRMIDLLDDQNPDGVAFKKLKALHGRFTSSRFLVDPDPPGWLLGQCVAWAKLAYAEVSERPLDLAVGVARNIPERAGAAGFKIEINPKKARIGALVVWDDGGAGHVGIVSGLVRNPDTGEAAKIEVSEANWGTATASGASRWGLSLDEARGEIVTDMYGHFSPSVQFSTDNLDRPPPGAKEPRSFKFIGYVLP